MRDVHFYPQTGWEDRPWLDDPGCDALAKSGRRVVESYSDAVGRRRLEGKASTVRIFLSPAPDGQEHVSVEVHLDFFESFESARAFVPDTVSELSASDRADLALRILTATMTMFGPERGWSTEVLSAAEAEVRDLGLEFDWQGPWKSSPDRRREARAVFWLEDHGHGRAVIEVRDCGARDEDVLRSESAAAFCTSAGFARSAKTLRWVGSEVVLTPSMGLVGQRSGELRYDPASGDTGTVPGRSDDAGSGRPGPAVVAVRSPYIADSHEIRFIGGGPSNNVPAAYLEELGTQLDHLALAGREWWSAADRTLLEITWHIDDVPDSRVKVRRLANRVTAQIVRSLPSFDDGDPGQLARDDVRSLIAAVARRMKLPEAPGL